jgi:FixJ family two-component response regulator
MMDVLLCANLAYVFLPHTLVCPVSATRILSFSNNVGSVVLWNSNLLGGIAMIQAPAPVAPVVHIIDDDDSVRLMLDTLLRSVKLNVRTYSSTEEFLKTNSSNAPGCIVLDIRLPGVNGLDFQEQLQEIGISLPVVLMTGHGDIPMTVRGMKAGAVDFLPKPFRDQDMIDAVTKAINRHQMRRSHEDWAIAVANRFGTLSSREREVMMLVTSGKMNKQVAGELGLSEITVKMHRGAVMRKMEAHSFADLVRMADTLKEKAR